MYFTQSHEWLELKGNVGIIGITHHAQNELGEIVYIELPKIGRMIKVGEETCVLESTKAAADVYAPVSGKIIAVNEILRETPSLVNQKAQSEGWLFKIEIANPKELTQLLSKDQYESLIIS